MRVVHEAKSGGDRRVLASEVELADSTLARTRGLMFRDSIPDDYALVMRFGRAGYRGVHMLFVRFPIDAVWLRDGTVRQVKTLAPWRGVGIARADVLLELPAGAAADVTAADSVAVES